MSNNKKKSDNESSLILKSGATDLRRQEKSLLELADRNYPEGLKANVLYAFSNKNNTSIKIVKKNSDSSTMLIKLKREKPYPWIEYKAKGTDGYTVELKGTNKKQFLREIEYPENI